MVTINGKTGFYKVAETGFSLTDAIFFNPDTKEVISKIVWDIDDDRVAIENEYLYYEPIDENIRKQFMRFRGIIQVGDTIEVVKGRKVPIGTIAKVVKIWEYKDRYNRVQTIYVNLDNGMKTSILNCKLV